MRNLYLELKQIKNNSKGKLFLVLFRVSNYFAKSKIRKVFGFPIRIGYKLLFNYILCIDIPDSTCIGLAFNVFHGQGLVISKDTKIGDYVTVRQNTTIGNARTGGGSPIIGNNVQIGANSVIIGEISIGDNAIIAAGSIVINDVPSFSIVAGNPAKVVKLLIDKK